MGVSHRAAGIECGLEPAVGETFAAPCRCQVIRAEGPGSYMANNCIGPDACAQVAPEDSAFHGLDSRDALAVGRDIRAVSRDPMAHWQQAPDARHALARHDWPHECKARRSAPGRPFPQSQVKLVQAAEPGIVREILVRDGDTVQAGQVVIRMDATVSGADAAALAHELALKRLTVRAIDAALANRPLTLDPTDPPALYSQVSSQFMARRQALGDAIAQEEKAATRVQHDRTAAQQVRDKLAATLPSYRQSAEGFTKLHREGFVGELIADEKRREVIEREQDLKAQEATLQALASAIAPADSRITQLRSQFRSQLLSERVEAEAAVSRLAQDVAKAGFRSGLLEVRAPVAGTVRGLSTTTLGAVVQAGAQLLTVVPQGDVLRAEAVLANDDIGFVQVG